MDTKTFSFFEFSEHKREVTKGITKKLEDYIKTDTNVKDFLKFVYFPYPMTTSREYRRRKNVNNLSLCVSSSKYDDTKK